MVVSETHHVAAVPDSNDRQVSTEHEETIEKTTRSRDYPIVRRATTPVAGASCPRARRPNVASSCTAAGSRRHDWNESQRRPEQHLPTSPHHARSRRSFCDSCCRVVVRLLPIGRRTNLWQSPAEHGGRRNQWAAPRLAATRTVIGTAQRPGHGEPIVWQPVWLRRQRACGRSLFALRARRRQLHWRARAGRRIRRLAAK